MRNSSFTSKSRTGILIGIGAAFIVAGCESRGTDEASRFAPPPAALAAGTHVDFALLQEKVLTPYCMSCHSEFATEDGVKFYVKPGDPGGSSLYLDVAKGDMPPGGPQLADTVVQIVSEYIVELGKAR